MAISPHTCCWLSVWHILSMACVSPIKTGPIPTSMPMPMVQCISHPHRHHHAHAHVHLKEDKAPVSIWWLFIIFIFGPCEALIPVLMYPAGQQNYIALAFVTSVFVLATLITMAAAVCVCFYGAHRIKAPCLYQYSHALAGGLILLCGVTVIAGF